MPEAEQLNRAAPFRRLTDIARRALRLVAGGIGSIHLPDLENPPPPDEVFIPFPIFKDLDRPDKRYERMEREREGSRTLMGNTKAMRRAGEKFLPRWLGKTGGRRDSESDFQFDRRLGLGLLINLYGSMVRSTVDAAYSKPLQLEDFPDELVELAKMISKDGSSFDQYARLASLNSLSETISHTLIDMSGRQQGASPAQDEARQPFWLNIPALELIGIEETEGADGRVRLLEARRLYTVEVAQEDSHNSGLERRVQIFHRGMPALAETLDRSELKFSSSVIVREVKNEKGKLEWRVWVETFGHFVPPEGAVDEIVERFIEIPIVPAHTVKTGFFRGRLAAENLADMQLTHWRKGVEKDTALAVSLVPAQFFSGFSAQQVESIPWGPFMAVHHTDTDATVTDIAHSLNTFEMASEDLDILQRQMAVVALEPSVSKATGDELATIRQIDEAKQLTRKEAWLMTWIESFLESWRWTAAYLNIVLDPDAAISPNEAVFDALRGNAGYDLVLELTKTLNESESATVDRLALEEAKRKGVISERTDIDELLGFLAAERQASGAGSGVEDDNQPIPS